MDDPPIRILYRNHRGEVSVRRIIPRTIQHEHSPHYPKPCWIMRAYDLDKCALRDFSVSNILAIWEPAEE